MGLKNCLLAGVIFLTMESIFQPPVAGIKIHTFNFIVTGRRLAVKLGGIFNKQTKPQKTIHEKVFISRKPLKLYTMYTEKEIEAKITLLVKEHEELMDWLSLGENVSKIDDTTFGMMILLESVQKAYLNSLISLKNYISANPDAYKY